jgi:hypothetical protein
MYRYSHLDQQPARTQFETLKGSSGRGIRNSIDESGPLNIEIQALAGRENSIASWTWCANIHHSRSHCYPPISHDFLYISSEFDVYAKSKSGIEIDSDCPPDMSSVLRIFVGRSQYLDNLRHSSKPIKSLSAWKMSILHIILVAT